MRSILALVAAAVLAGSAAAQDPSLGPRPIIGILTLPNDVSPSAGKSYFPASYVKFVEGAGGRVVPIPYDMPVSQVQELTKYLNGFLFTGGSAIFFNKDGSLTQFATTAQILFNASMSAAAQGETLPLWGTCLGHELILSLAAGQAGILTNGFDSENYTIPFVPTAAAASSRLYSSIDARGMKILTTQNVTMNAHQAGVAPNDFNRYPGAANNFNILGIGQDRTGRAFVSSAEGKTAPIYSTQFHTEKVLYEWPAWENINHSDDSVYANYQFSRFFLSEARKNSRSFPDPAAEAAALIYNYTPVYTGATSNFMQCYYFD